MSRATVRNQLLLNDGGGQKFPIQTGVWVSSPVNIDEHRRLSLTIGVGGATGAVGDVGGFTGTLSVQGTDELAQSNGPSGCPWAGDTSLPGKNGTTGGLFWTQLASGAIGITAATTSVLVQFTDVGVAFVRLVFNGGPMLPTATGTLGGSGLMSVFLTAKNT